MQADDCQSMEQVRQEIDRIDRLLVGLLAERQTYVTRAAQIKPSRDVVRDPARVEDVISKVKATAADAGFSPKIAETVWRAMVEEFIAYEDREFVANQ